MARFRNPANPNQGLLLPPSPRDWLPEGHLVWFIMETVAELDIDTLLDKSRMSGKGELPYHPRVLLQLLVYAYCTGTFASRRIATQIEENIAFRVLAGELRPSHRTICRFREENLDEFQRLFVQVVQIAQESGFVKMGTIAIDGTKLKANASKHKAMSYERMLVEEKRLRSEIAKLTRAAKDQDELDDKSFGPDFRGDDLPAEVSRRETRLATIQAAKKRLEERKAKDAADKRAAEAKDDDKTPPEAGKDEKVLPQPKDQENFTDPESRIMKTSGKSFEQCYNAQAAVDAKNQLIVGATVTQSANDSGQLMPAMNAAYEATKVAPKRVLADAGYKNETAFAELHAMKVEGYVAVGREGKDAKKPKQEQQHTAAMRARLATKRGRARYRQRKSIVEPVFGWVKRVLGFRAFSLRGLRKVVGEWSLVCLALNLRRMAKMEVAR